MSWLYRHLVRPALFTQDPEAIHEWTISALGWVSRQKLLSEAMRAFCGAQNLPTKVGDLSFPNPIGLAAGMDKAGDAVPAWQNLGFGFTELGAATWKGQPGNDRPRVFRAIQESAIVNRMGFNNPGAEAIAGRLAAWRGAGFWPSHPVGMNLGKSKVTPLEEAAEDYANSFRILKPYLDFFVVNVSSPNTPDLRELQGKAALDQILQVLQQENLRSDGDATGEARPIWVKVAPDLSFQALDDILELVEPRDVRGIIATNTTITRPESDLPNIQTVYAEPGGLSGRPLRARSTEVIRYLYRQANGSVPIIGVGGIFTVEDAWEKIAAGASLLQIYTGLIYEGPTVVRELVAGLRSCLREKGFATLSDAVGSESKSE